MLFRSDLQDRRQRYDTMVAQGLAEIKPPKTDAERASLRTRQAAVIKSYSAEKRAMEADVKQLSDKVLGVLSGPQLTAWKAISPP